MKKIDWSLYLIADVEAVKERNMLSLIKEATEGGVSVVQLRAKKLNTLEFLEISLNLRQFLKQRKIPFIINDRLDIALAIEADGVHLGPKDLPLRYARKLMGEGKIIGASVNYLEEAIKAEQEGADYLGVGPIYFTPTKEDLRPVLGVEGLIKIRERVKLPIIAIGGINKQNAPQVISKGADGVAVISAILASEDIRKAAKELLDAILRAKKTQP